MEIDHHFASVNPPDIPIVRFFTWNKPAISCGCNQDQAKRLDLERCRKDGIDLVRRPTGGREILHGHDLSYSVIWPFDDICTGVEARGLFGRINDILTEALCKLGVDASWGWSSRKIRPIGGPCFAQVDRGEINVDGRKLVASAQRVFEKTILQQGSMPLSIPLIDICIYLKGNDGDSLRELLNRNSTYLYEYVDETISTQLIVGVFRKAFEDSFESRAGCITEYPESNKIVNSKAINRRSSG